MHEEWRRTTWGAVSSLKYGKALKDYTRSIGDTRVFGTNGPVGWSTVKATAVGPRAVVGRKGAYRGVHLAQGPFWVIDTAYWLEPEPQLDAVWSYYKLLTIDINGMDSGSAIPSLNRDHFHSLPLVLPPLEEQRQIAGVFGALDDLAMADMSLASHLRDAAYTAYQACLQGGSVRQKLGDVIDLRYGKSLPARARKDGDVPVLSSAGNIGFHNKPLVKGPGVVVGRKGSVGSVHWVSRDFFPIDTAFYVESNLPMLFVYFALRDLGLDEMNTDSAVPGLNRSNALSRRIRVPDSTRLAQFETRSAAFWESADEVEAEARQLVSTRDELLPLLMSGRVRVGEVAT